MYRFHFTHEDIGINANVNWHGPDDGIASIVKVKDETDKNGVLIPLSAFSAEEISIIEQACENAADESDRGWREVA